jgi:hypothetical protein
MDDDRVTEALRADALAREHEERQRAQAAAGGQEEHAHRRRAEKAEYLRRKLEDRSESERRG